MGAAHSRRNMVSKDKRPRISGAGLASTPTTGYFMLSYKADRVKVVNADSGELKLLTSIIRRHCQILKEGWDRHLTYSYRLKVVGRHSVIQLVADTLLSLYQAGWQPMTPMDMGLCREQSTNGSQTTICFKRKENTNSSEGFTSSSSSLTRIGNSIDGENSCLCLEIFQSNYLGLHNASNTVLHELVTTIQKEWSPGIRGVSSGVASVITDYTTNMPPVLPTSPHLREEKYMQLEGQPWVGGQEDPVAKERLQQSIISCLAREGFKLSMDVNMEGNSVVYFFIRETEEHCGEVRVPSMLGNVHKPKLGRTSSSTHEDLRSAVARRKLGMVGSSPFPDTGSRSLKRGGLGRGGVEPSPRGGGGVMSYKPTASTPAWWQQTSTDVSSDHDDDC